MARDILLQKATHISTLALKSYVCVHMMCVTSCNNIPKLPQH